jgi:DNA-directed RNA polymerase I, II, and III subunit RPABC1
MLFDFKGKVPNVCGVLTKKFEMENREIIRLWRVYKTVHEMVSDRGYLVAKSELEMSLEDFKQTYTTAGVIE